MTTTLTVVGLVYFEVAVPVDAVKMGRESHVPRIEVGAGGALNTAWIAKALGVPVLLAYPSGVGVTDTAVSLIISRLSLSTYSWDARDDTAISLVLTGEDDRAFVSSADLTALERCPEVGTSSWIHVPGLREARLLEPRLRAAKERGSRISVAGSWAVEELETLAGSKTCWDLLFLSEPEAERASGSIEDAPERLGSVAPNVIVTRGARGATGVFAGEPFSVAARSIAVTNATGAGDAFAAGFLAGCIAGEGPRTAAELGCEVAARWLTAGRDRLGAPLFEGVEVPRR